MEAQLKEACRLTGAKWAALAEREGGKWLIRSSHRLSKKKQAALKKFLEQDSMDTWLVGALNEASSRSESLPLDAKLDAPRLYVFPVATTSQALLVGARRLSANNQGVWHLVSGLITAEHQSVDNDFLPDIQTELSYDMPRALDRVLAGLVSATNTQGAWLAIRRGDTLDIAAQFNDTRGIGISLSVESNLLLRRINHTHAEIAVNKGQPEWNQIPHAEVKSNTKIWCCFPLTVGQRLIGAVALWRNSEFEAGEWPKLREIAKRVSSSVEVIVTFAELTNHLRRLAMLNDFALTISSAQNLDQIARRVFGLLSRSFSTEFISLDIPSADERLMREFTNRDGRFAAQMWRLPVIPRRLT